VTAIKTTSAAFDNNFLQHQESQSITSKSNTI